MNDLKNIYNQDLTDELYNLDDEEKAFFKAETKIEGDEELKKHIIAVQIKAYAVGRLSFPLVLIVLAVSNSQEDPVADEHVDRTQIYRYPCIRIFEFAR